jgi:3-oxoacyl-[acyl-carrier protein] reductase
MNLSLKNKNAFVGGSSKGIGFASAVELANNEASVTLVGRNEELLKQKLSQLPVLLETQMHDYVVLDYSDIENLKSVVNQLALKKNYQILVNNTGGPAGGDIINESQEKFESVFQQHLIANQILAQAFMPSMKEAGFGRIVNVISVSVKQPLVGLGVSNTIRWAVAAWAKTLSKEIAQFGITVNNVLPGYTLTGRLDEVLSQKSAASNIARSEIENQILTNIPTGKFATAEEVAAAVAFLCSPIAASINGINLPVDGGLSMSL